MTVSAPIDSPPDDPLAVLEVVDRLEVGPVALLPDRLTMPYRVVRGELEESFELVYRYGETVFDPGAAADSNLAAMIGAQVALNYGLFCREIIFKGRFGREDRRFLERMLANTAREIYVKKILEPNPFLAAPALGLPVVRRRSYLRATVRFEAAGSGGGEAPAGGEARGSNDPGKTVWDVDPGRFAILSSGGKDSLLAYGLLAELGRETHPVFINESGRHWFTALKAFRHFEREVPHTARVWTNCDRLFSHMLRHLPFVRTDFHTRRSDEYPIRLWTVAVFLFGALPLLRRRGVGRLVIGDEYDTTVRASYQGIPHFDGLYDQSIDFDHALSRYFQRKGWGVTQFSLLRPLSELLIQRVLAERYPRLLRLQVSCHAAHTEGEDVRPCGKCEKCRRIAGMLIALGADPEDCGYSAAQCEQMLPALVEKGVHQERPTAEHLAYLLHRRGLLRAPRIGAAPARRREEAEKLRFHPRSSPLDEIPLELREPLYRIFLEHSAGAIERIGRAWIELDVLASDRLLRPYGFDRPSGGAAGEPRSHLWGEMTWPQAQRRLRQVDVALLPVGAVEQHGPHLPLDTDSFDADYLARRVAAGCGEPRPLVLPLVSYGVSFHHEDFSGTLSVSNETLARLVHEIGMSAAKNGIRKLVIVNGHGGNAPTLHFAAQTINRDAHIFTCVDSGETSDADVTAMIETPGDVHAGEIETSTSLALRPHLVRMDLAEARVQQFSSRFLDFSSERSVEWYARTRKLSDSGVMGDPTKASAEKGEKIWRVMIDHLVELVEHLRDLSLEEIYERRY